MTTIEASAWFGLLAPAGTPHPVIDRLSMALAAALKDGKVKTLLANHGDEPSFSTPAEFGAYIRDETATWTKVVKSAGLAVD